MFVEIGSPVEGVIVEPWVVARFMFVDELGSKFCCGFAILWIASQSVDLEVVFTKVVEFFGCEQMAEQEWQLSSSASSRNGHELFPS